MGIRSVLVDHSVIFAVNKANLPKIWLFTGILVRSVLLRPGSFSNL